MAQGQTKQEQGEECGQIGMQQGKRQRSCFEMSLDRYNLLNVACDVHFHFLLSSSNVDEIKFCVH
jgi:hypothetical protein